MSKAIVDSLVMSLREEVSSLAAFLFGHPDTPDDVFYTGKCMIAGGWITCKLADIQALDGDLDIWFENEKELAWFCKEIVEYGQGLITIEETALSKTFFINGKKIQLITCTLAPFHQVLAGFDILPCSVGLVVDSAHDTASFLATDGALDCIELMELEFSPHVAGQITVLQDTSIEIPRDAYFDITFERVIKYIKRGFNLTPTAAKLFNSLVRIAARQPHSGVELQRKKHPRRDLAAYRTIPVGNKAILGTQHQTDNPLAAPHRRNDIDPLGDLGYLA